MWKRLLFWDFPRGSRPYDIMVGFILIFIFLTPRDFFRDQPKIPSANQVAVLPSEHGSNVFIVDTEMLAGVSEELHHEK